MDAKTEIEWLLARAVAECAMSGTPIGCADAAEATLRRVLDLDPNNLEGLNLLAQVRAQRGDPEEAIQLVEHASHHAPGADVVVRLTTAVAEVCEDKQMYELAVNVYKIGLSYAESASLYDGSSYCHAKLGRFAEAVDLAERAVALEPCNAKLLSNLGYVLIEAGRSAEAERPLLRAVALDPGNELANGNLTLCRQRLSGPGSDAPRKSRRGRPPGK